MPGMKSLSTSVNLVTLGCAKNLVDSEKLLRQLEANGFRVSHNSPEFSDIVIINTCGFILDAKTESIETILSYIHAKKHGFIRKVIVMGCLSGRYSVSLKAELPEVDGFFGVNQEKEIIGMLGGKYYSSLLHERTITTPSHYAYLKISEGCNRNCSFCTIPAIRGKQVSRTVNDIIAEAQFLEGEGVKEIILIAQDLTSYGTDIYKKKSLVRLVRELIQLDRIDWIRLHYTYPHGFPADEIISLMQSSSKICRYLDLPLQHVSEKILKLMNRGHGRKEFENIIHHFRKEIPDIAIRTTFITGFPGETERDFQELKNYVKEARFDRLGIFTYSEEEGTSAADLKDDIPEEIKEERKQQILNLQESISLQLNLNKIGKRYKVLVDKKEGEFYTGRTEHDSPEIDNEVLIPVDTAMLKPGEFILARITDAIEYDLFGEVIERIS